MLHDQTAPALNSLPITSSAPQHFPTLVLIQEQRDDNKPLLKIIKEDKKSQATPDRRQMEIGYLPGEDNYTADSDLYLKEFQSQLLRCPDLGLQSLQIGKAQSSACKTEKHMGVEPCDVVALAKKALSASKQAVLLAEEYKSSGANLDESLTPSSRSTSLDDFPVEKEKIVRSARLLERKLKRRGVAKQTIILREDTHSKKVDLQTSKSKTFDRNDPLGLFFLVPETKQLLTLKEESKLIVHIQDLMVLEEVKSRLHTQFGREPTLVEWAEAVELSSCALKSQIHNGNSSREKLIYANFRMVVHIAKKYQGQGLGLQDLLQEGSKGLMRSVEKFKPQAGCRFATYAYWWIRQSVRKAIFRHSRLIRLPDNVYGLLYKITEAKRLCIQDGDYNPTNKDIAARAGMTVEKLERLQMAARSLISLEQSVWADQNTTYHQITADPSVETLDVTVTKQIMRRHVRSLLNILSPKERKIMCLRYGIEGSKRTSLSELGLVFGLCKERVRQIEIKALYKLRQCSASHGLDAYADLVV
ncbi:hypothetical protein LguiB_035127 [Lonicera macranthoides]